MVTAGLVASYAAAMKKLDVRLFRLGDEYSLLSPASPESAILARALALNRSTSIYSNEVKIGHALTSGRSEKRGRSSGGWWKTPPSYGLTL